MFLPNSFQKCRSSRSQMLFRSIARRCSVKRLFLVISQNSQENTCARVSLLIKLQAKNFILKRDPGRDVSCEFYKIWKNTFFLQYTSAGCFQSFNIAASYKFPDIHQKIYVLKSLFNTGRGLKTRNFNKKKRSQHKCFLENITTFLKIAALQNTPGGCF